MVSWLTVNDPLRRKEPEICSGAEVLLQKNDDLLPVAGGEVEAAARTFAPSRRIALGQFGSVPSIDDLLVASNLETDRTGGAVQSSSNKSHRGVSIAEVGNGVPFILRELVIATQVCVLFRGRNRAHTVSPLSQYLPRALHLLLESTGSNKSLE
jgi:hypothetical protein